MNPFNHINATLSDLLTPDIHTPGVPRGHGAVVAYSTARVQEIIAAVRLEQQEAVDAKDAQIKKLETEINRLQAAMHRSIQSTGAAEPRVKP